MAVVTQIQVRRGTAANWTSTNPTLAAGEFGFETDTNKLKCGNGSSAWTALSYLATGATGTVTSVVASTGLTGGTITSTGTIAIDTSVVTTLTGTQTLTNKTLTTPIISSISNSGTVTLPTATTTLVGTDTTDTLTNKTLTAPIINLALNAQTGTTYTFVLTDNGKLVTASNASAQTYTIPLNSSVAYAIGAQINVIAIGAGQVSFAATAGVTIASTGATSTAPKLRVQYSSATLIKVATDTWYVIGDIS